MVLIFAVAALLFAGANAECANACSGHGYCTNYKPEFSSAPLQIIQLAQATSSSYFGYSSTEYKKDTCTCFSHLGHNGKEVFQFTGPDCSILTCPWGQAHAGDTLSASDQIIDSTYGGGSSASTGAGGYHSQYSECSGKGYCDGGKCQCYPGYEGDACQRTSCPNQCSNAGRCLTLKQIAEDVKDDNAFFYGDYFSSLAYDNAFDSETAFGCVCDLGRSGPDCSYIDCPSGDDVMGGPGSLYGRACSGRGTCDGTTGVCQCFEGFFGTRCESQRSAQV